MQSRLSRYKDGWNWEIYGVERDEMGAFYWSITLLLLINVIFLSVYGPLLKRHYPRSLGFRDMLVPLYIVSALSFLPLYAMHGIERKDNQKSRLSKLFASMIFFVLAGLHLFYSISIPEIMRLIDQVRNFENSNDTDVAVLTTYYLAVYSDCCFLRNEEAPSFDCNSTGFEAPCYEDEELFESFLDDFSLANSKCLALTGSDPYGEHDEDGFPSNGICKKNERSFFTRIGTKTYRRFWTLSVPCLFYGFFSFWCASEYFFFCLGDML